MRPFFYPKSIVVIGASTKPNNLARRLLSNLRAFGFPGKVFAVGQGGGQLEGVPVLPSVGELPETVDLAAVLTPARFVADLIRECGEKGIRHAVILTGGFAETSEAGSMLQQEISTIAQHYRIRFIGPNCFGIICPESGVALPFAPISPDVIGRGSLSILSQSGSVGMLTAYNATVEGIGIAKYVSMGNKLDVDEVDLLPYFMEEDPETETICFYLEGLARGREFAETARRSAKPLVVLKANISAENEHAARSHTASLASDDRVVEGVFRQAGITRVSTLNEMITAAKALSLPPLRGNNVAVVSCTGGQSVIAADHCHRYGFHLPPLSDSVFNALAEFRKGEVIRWGNPLDMGGIFDNNGVLLALERVLAEPQIDGVAAALFHFGNWAFPGPDTLGIIRRISAISCDLQKPLALTLHTQPHLLQQVKLQTKFPIFNNVDECMAALAILRRRADYLAKPKTAPMPLQVDRMSAAQSIAKARGEGLQDMGPAAMGVLGAYGLPVAPLHVSSSPEEAVRLADRVGYPVVLKAVAPGLSHKSDMGGVILNLVDPVGVRKAFAEIRGNMEERNPPLRFAGVVVQRMVTGGHEFILGARRDPSFGPVIMFGLGGIFTEFLGDVTFRLAPISFPDVEEMIWEVKGSGILRGLRGQPAADVKALADALQRLGQLILDHEEISEIDVNPVKVFAHGNGAVAVDARIVLSR
jgi:acetate---CoA ligase (ADP-forming)